MHFVYYDESGDDGQLIRHTDQSFQNSPIFVLTCCWVQYKNWKSVYNSLHNLRKEISNDFGLPVKVEMHTRDFMFYKSMYREFNLTPDDRLLILDKFIDTISSLPIVFTNIVIDKTQHRNSQSIIDTALSFSIQRIENTFHNPEKMDPENNRYLIISDKGRIPIMKRTARRLQVYNPVPSRYGGPRRLEIKYLLEDILSKDSKESYFIQLCDLVSYIVYLYGIENQSIRSIPNRLTRNNITSDKIKEWLNKLKISNLNLAATRDNMYGIKFYRI
jgi:hypothetical protein